MAWRQLAARRWRNISSHHAASNNQRNQWPASRHNPWRQRRRNNTGGISLREGVAIAAKICNINRQSFVAARIAGGI